MRSQERNIKVCNYGLKQVKAQRGGGGGGINWGGGDFFSRTPPLGPLFQQEFPILTHRHSKDTARPTPFKALSLPEANPKLTLTVPSPAF